MQDEEGRHLKRRPLHIKQLGNRLNRKRKAYPLSSSPVFALEQKRALLDRETQKNIGLKINEQNISLIAKKEGSFISRQDHSLDSFDKILIGVDEQGDVNEQDTFNSKEQEPNYSMLYQQFEKLIKEEKMYKKESSMEIEQSHILKEDSLEEQIEQDNKQAQEKEGKQCNISDQGLNQKHLREKVEEVRELHKTKSQTECNISLRLLANNLSQINEEEIQHNISVNRMDPIEQQFIEFVGKGEGSKVNISKIQKIIEGLKEKGKFKNQLNNSLKQGQQDEVVAMLENELGSRRQPQIEEEESLLNQENVSASKKNKKSFFKENYNQILKQLDENEQKKIDSSHNTNVWVVLAKREEWINRSGHSEKWKQKQLSLLNKFKDIMDNPCIQFHEEEFDQQQL